MRLWFMIVRPQREKEFKGIKKKEYNESSEATNGCLSRFIIPILLFLEHMRRVM